MNVESCNLRSSADLDGQKDGDDASREGFDGSIFVSVPVSSTPGDLYALVTDIENLSNFFPGLEFKAITGGPLRAGDLYYARPRGTRRWVPYRITALEENARVAGELVGEDSVFEKFRYDHEFVATDGLMLSSERVDYKLRYGAIGRLVNALFAKRLLRWLVLNAHLKLKKISESRERKLAST